MLDRLSIWHESCTCAVCVGDVEQRVQCWFGCPVLPAVARHTGGAEVAPGAVKTHLRGTVGVVVSTCGAATDCDSWCAVFEDPCVICWVAGRSFEASCCKWLACSLVRCFGEVGSPHVSAS